MYRRHALLPALVLMALLLMTATFPVMEWTFSPGEDPSLVWVFNALFTSGSREAAHFLFPHGPLAWLMYPLPDHAVLTMGVYALLKISLFIGLWLAIAVDRPWWRMALALMVAFLLVMHSRLEFMLVCNVLVYCWLGLRRDERWPLQFVVLLVAFSFYIKATAGAMTTVLFMACLIGRVHRFGRWKHALFLLAELASMVVLLHLLLFGSLGGLGTRLLGLAQLTSDNSAAVSIYPYVPWGVVALGLMLALATLLGNKAPDGRYFAALTAPLLFAAWKHGMARADDQHVEGFIIIVGVVLFLAILFSPGRWWLRLPLAILAISLLSRTYEYTYHPTPRLWLSPGFARAALFVSDLDSVQKACEARSRGNIMVNRLPEDMRKRIGQATVDVYPWDLSIIPANGLNWRPRPVIQSYAAYTPWLDARDAAHFASTKAPEFIIWHLTGGDLDLSGTGMGSIDGRLTLNNEPRTMLELLSRYETVQRTSRFVLMRKRPPAKASTAELPGPRRAAWNRWVSVPEHGPGLVRVRVHIPPTAARRLKRFFYKDEQVWILMKSAQGRIFQYRIVPKNAEEGLWVSPAVGDPGACTPIEQVYFTSSGPALMPDSLDLAWEVVNWNDAPVPLFCADRDTMPGTLTYRMGTPDGAWQMPADNTVDGEVVRHSGIYSPTFTAAVDSLPEWVGRLAFSYWARVPGYRYLRTVSTVWDLEGPAGRLSWNSQAMDGVLVDDKTWAHVQYVLTLPEERNGMHAKAYVYNPGEEHIELKDLSVVLLPPLAP